jgi:hypothetical protein
MKTTFSEHMERLRAILNLLSTEYQEASCLIGFLIYPDKDESAQRMFRRDIDTLRALGFLIERTPEKRNPAYRLMGHVKWPYAADLDRVMAPKQYQKVREG